MPSRGPAGCGPHRQALQTQPRKNEPPFPAKGKSTRCESHRTGWAEARPRHWEPHLCWRSPTNNSPSEAAVHSWVQGHHLNSLVDRGLLRTKLILGDTNTERRTRVSNPGAERGRREQVPRTGDDRPGRLQGPRLRVGGGRRRTQASASAHQTPLCDRQRGSAESAAETTCPLTPSAS